MPALKLPLDGTSCDATNPKRCGDPATHLVVYGCVRCYYQEMSAMCPGHYAWWNATSFQCNRCKKPVFKGKTYEIPPL